MGGWVFDKFLHVYSIYLYLMYYYRVCGVMLMCLCVVHAHECEGEEPCLHVSGSKDSLTVLRLETFFAGLAWPCSELLGAACLGPLSKLRSQACIPCLAFCICAGD